MSDKKKIDIAPSIDEQGEPVCSGVECPLFGLVMEDTGTCSELPSEMDLDVYPEFPCIPGLRRQRDEARRELCANFSEHLGLGKTAHEQSYAASRGWEYLYPEK